MARRLNREEAAERLSRASYSDAAADRDVAEQAIRTLYTAVGIETPPVVWAGSPRGACLAADEVAGPLPCRTLPGDRLAPGRRRRKLDDEVTHVVLPGTTPSSVPFDRRKVGETREAAYPRALWRVIGFGHGVRDHPSRISSFIDWDDATADQQWALVRLAENIGWWRLHRRGAFLSERPERIVVDHLHRPHNTSGPAIAFRDGWTVHAVDGIRVPSWTVEHPEQIAAADVDGIINVELRRILVTLSGDRYIEQRGERVHADAWGELWEVEGVPGRFLRVTDATPGPHGTRRRYWLRVPQGAATAHEAVAWTFGLTAATYEPTLES